ncbi:MAG TPA: hypothetical protein VF240_22370 [Pyrinomonadaceae bacterium]
MKRCPSCGESYGDGVKFCDGDGTPLVAEFAPAEGRQTRWGALGVGLALGVAVCVAAFVLYRVATRDDKGATVATSPSSTPVRDAPPPPVRHAAAEPDTPTPTPSPEATPSLSPTPVPTPTPPKSEEDSLDILSNSPARTGGPEARADARVIFHLTDGASVEAEDAWKAPGGAWYRRGGVLEWLERSRIRSVERRAAPTPAPSAPQ